MSSEVRSLTITVEKNVMDEALRVLASKGGAAAQVAVDALSTHDGEESAIMSIEFTGNEAIVNVGRLEPFVPVEETPQDIIASLKDGFGRLLPLIGEFDPEELDGIFNCLTAIEGAAYELEIARIDAEAEAYQDEGCDCDDACDRVREEGGDHQLSFKDIVLGIANGIVDAITIIEANNNAGGTTPNATNRQSGTDD